MVSMTLTADQTPVPGVIGDLTSVWLDAALRSGGLLDVGVASIDVEPLGPSVGLLGDLARLHVAYRRGVGPATLIAKLPTSDPGGHHVGSMLRAWAREVAFYRELAPRSTETDIPTCFYTGADNDARRWVVVLEDCPSDPVDTTSGATESQARSAVIAIARFHAKWWESDQSFAWMPGFDTSGVGGLQPAWLEAIPTFLNRYSHVVPGPTGDWLQQFAPRLVEWSDRVAAEPLTVVHADYRLDNLLFKDDHVTIIDWQTTLRGPAAMDLTSFLATSLTIEQRRATETELIALYLDTLSDTGLAIDAGWFTTSYDENLLWWMGQFASNLSRLEPDDPQTQQALDLMIERTYTAGLDRDVGRLLG
jgi:hypothetical protein